MYGQNGVVMMELVPYVDGSVKSSRFRNLKIEVGRFGAWGLLFWTGLHSNQLDLNKSFGELISKALVDPRFW